MQLFSKVLAVILFSVTAIVQLPAISFSDTNSATYDDLLFMDIPPVNVVSNK
jgi:hypothetical protein